MNKKTRLTIYLGVGLLLTLIFMTKPSAAQEPLSDLRLLVWSADGSALIGTTPGSLITGPDNSKQQTQILWRLTPEGIPQQELGPGFAFQSSPDGRFITFNRFDNQKQVSRWQLDIETNKLQPVTPDKAGQLNVTLVGDPAGQVYYSPDGKKRAVLVNEFFEATLWVGINDEPVQQILTAEGEIFSGLSWHPNNNTLALIRTPLGNVIEAAGELWRIDLNDKRATRLSQNNAVDRSPIWSSDGHNLAVIRNDKLTLVSTDDLRVENFIVEQPELSRPDSADVNALAQLIPPTTIRVIHSASNTCRSVPVGQIDTIPFENYVKRVVPHEVYPSWPAETLKAQAVAARTYGWDKYLQNLGEAYHVTDWVNHQYMCDTTTPTTDAAVEATTGQYLAYNGQIITAMFSAENSSPTKSSIYVNYLRAIDDPVSFGRIRYGHGYGMGQWGAQRWADQYGWNYRAILRHYYNATVEQAGAPTDSQAPQVTIVTPSHNLYVTSHKLRLTLNTSDDSGSITKTNIYASTPTSNTLLVSENGPANSNGYVVDISAWLDQALVDNTLVLSAEAFDASGKRGVSVPVTIGLDRVNPTGLLTAIPESLNSQSVTASATISFTLSGADITSGLRQLALGQQSWSWQESSLIREDVGGQLVGQVISDSDALNGLALQASSSYDPAGMWFSPAITLPTPQQYRAYFRVKINDNTLPNEVARLEIVDEQGTVIGIQRLHSADFRNQDTYHEFHTDFDLQSATSVVFRLIFLAVADISLDRIIMVEYPQAYTTTLAYNNPDVRMKVIDGAGNVSTDLQLLSTPPQSKTHQVFLPFITTFTLRWDE